MKKKKIKYFIAVVVIVIFTFSVVLKIFQNDTFYVIKLGNQIMNTGVDWQDHYSIHKNLEYRYPHWAFDVVVSWIYNLFNFDGVYVLTQVFASIFMLIIFCNMLKKNINFNLAFLSTLITAYMMKSAFCARGQVVSYSIFLLEYILIEKFLEKPSFLKIILLTLLSCIMANFHSTAWIMMLILVLPFIGEHVVYMYSLRGVNEKLLKKYKKQYEKAKVKNFSEEKISKIEKEIKHLEEFKQKNTENFNKQEVKIVINKVENIKYIWFVIIALIVGSLMTPLKFTPILYVLKTSLGNSMNYINEHLPIVPANNLEFFVYTAIVIIAFGFTNSKMKLSDACLVLGLYIMTLSSRRNEYLLIGLTSSIIVKMFDDFIKFNIKEENPKISKIFYKIICVVSIVVSIYMFIINFKDSYIPKEIYPVEATKYIKNNLDYKNIRIFNDYDYGSYLLMEDIPVFIDSRCDLYTSQFNKGVTVFEDSMAVLNGSATLSSIMDKYDLEYAILRCSDVAQKYVIEDSRYEEIYKDKNFAIYKYKNK